jgi:hypothetical protein
MDIPLVSHSPDEEYLDCFYFGVIMKNAAVLGDIHKRM